MHDSSIAQIESGLLSFSWYRRILSANRSASCRIMLEHFPAKSVRFAEENASQAKLEPIPPEWKRL
jgi:hypothetical protein